MDVDAARVRQEIGRGLEQGGVLQHPRGLYMQDGVISCGRWLQHDPLPMLARVVVLGHEQGLQLYNPLHEREHGSGA